MSGIENLGALDDEAGGAKAAEQSDEVFRDQQKKTQQQVTAIKKAEANAKQKDHRLAAVLGKFLQNHSNTQIMLLIARCIDHNIPAGLILGLLALVEPEAQAEFEKLMGETAQLLQAPEEGTRALVAQQDFNSAHLPEHVKLALDAWGRGLFEFGLTQPMRLLTTAASPEGELFPSLAQLATFLLQQYLAGEKINTEYASTHEFAELLLKNVLAKIREQLGGTKELGSGED